MNKIIRKNFNVKILIITLLFAFVFNFANTNNAGALKVNDKCEKVEIVFARGSGEGEPADNEAIRYHDQIERRLQKDTVNKHSYNLGTESYNNNSYPHVSVGDWSFGNAIGASLSAGNYFAYGDSVKSGVGELKSYLSQRYEKCKSSGTLYILGGYSQGAQVIGQALPNIAKEIRDRIVFVGLFGDPKLHYPEGEGWNPPACRGKDFSPWRRAASNCNLDNGSLSARNPYLPTDMKTKTGLWCYAKDSICDPGALGQMSGHETYRSPGMAIDLAAKEAVSKLKQRIIQEAPNTPPSESQPDYNAIDTMRPIGAGINGNNVLFIVDTASSMKPYFTQLSEYITTTGRRIIERGGSYEVVLYSKEGNTQNNGILAPYLGFTTDLNRTITIKPACLGYCNSISSYPTYVYTASPLYTFNNLAPHLNWKYGATKSVILFTNNPSTNEASLADTLALSLRIDPVNFYPVVPASLEAEYTPLAKDTSGQVSPYSDSKTLLDAAETAYIKTVERPVPFLANSDYLAAPGQEITFDSSESYTPNATITKYEWDFDGDSIFETTTTTPTVNHTYVNAFDGYMQVRVTADNNTVANASAKVVIKSLTPPAAAPQPKQLTATVTKTTDTKSTIKLSWQANASVEQWRLTINDMPVGYLAGNKTSVELTDIDRTADVTFGLASVTASNTSAYSTVTVAAQSSSTPSPTPAPPPPPVTSTCTQSNLFVRLLCQAIALAKIYLNGVLTYILPYKL